jgi:hypothetical protein
VQHRLALGVREEGPHGKSLLRPRQRVKERHHSVPRTGVRPDNDRAALSDTTHIEGERTLNALLLSELLQRVVQDIAVFEAQYEGAA